MLALIGKLVQKSEPQAQRFEKDREADRGGGGWGGDT